MKTLSIGLCALLLAGCASTPPLVYKYYPAKVTAQVTVTQTVDCDADKHLVIVNTPTISSAYSADRSAKLLEFDATKLGGAFTDNDFTFSWYDDGRMKSLNSAVTGQGEAIVKAGTTLLTAVLGGAAPTDDSAACKVVASRGGGKPVTIVYEQTLDDLTKAKPLTKIPVSENYKGSHDVLANMLPLLEVKVDVAAAANPVLVEPSSSAGSAGKEGVPLTLAKTAMATVTVTKSKIGIGKSIIVVPTSGTYELAVPRGAFFGKATFSIQLNEAGVPTQVSYGKTSGMAAALNSANALDAAFASPSEAAQAAALKNQADVIAQTTRLANCQAKPAECK